MDEWRREQGATAVAATAEETQLLARALLHMKAAVDAAPCACGENDGHLVHITTCWKAELRP